ncbi:MAG: 30S ribosomal protein S9 [Phycisphaerales bacterium JB039]
MREPIPADKHGWWWGTGRRKTAVARVRMRPAEGKGDFKIQVSRKKFKTIDEYFCELRDRADCVAPMRVTDTEGKFDVVVRCGGGGFMGQAQAVRLGIARALRNYDPTLEDALRDHGYLTRDPRKVERKKYGQPGARKRFQFSKR